MSREPICDHTHSYIFWISTFALSLTDSFDFSFGGFLFFFTTDFLIQSYTVE